jgi:hypothetical protein
MYRFDNSSFAWAQCSIEMPDAAKAQNGLNFGKGKYGDWEERRNI